MIILNEEYADESMIDVGEDIYYAVKKANLPRDEYGLVKGTFKVTIEWYNSEEEEDNDLV